MILMRASPGRNACCRKEKQPLLPVIVIAMLRSLPSNFCHSLTEVLFRLTTERRSSRILTWRCGGNDMDFDEVSMSHPRMIFCVDQKLSPFSSFLTEIGCFWSPSRSSLGRKMRSMPWKMVLLTRMQLNQP